MAVPVQATVIFKEYLREYDKLKQYDVLYRLVPTYLCVPVGKYTRIYVYV